MSNSETDSDGRKPGSPPWPWLPTLLLVALVLLLICTPRPRPAKNDDNTTRPVASGSGRAADRASGQALPVFRRGQNHEAATPEQIVAHKLQLVGASRRRLAQALAQRHGVTAPDRVERFFDAVEAGNWDEIKARFTQLGGGDGRPSEPDVKAMWAAILDAYGVAEQAHLWPARQLLDYGSSVLDSLRPGMVYVGGTDNGRWIPELVNEDSGGPQHIILTQNAFADSGYLEMLNVQYGDQLNALTAGDAGKAYQDYLDDYQKRLMHDQQFPDEPRQIRPGESAGVSPGEDGKPRVYGVNSQMSVMAINEVLLNALMDKNPGMTFALQESFPMRSTYDNALPLGPLMELRADTTASSFSSQNAAQSLGYWQSAAGQLLADPEASGSSTMMMAYAKDAASAANLLVAHNYNSEAQQVYESALQLSPVSPEAIYGYTSLMLQQNQPDKAVSAIEKALQVNPFNADLSILLNKVRNSTAH